MKKKDKEIVEKFQKCTDKFLAFLEKWKAENGPVQEIKRTPGRLYGVYEDRDLDSCGGP